MPRTKTKFTLPKRGPGRPRKDPLQVALDAPRRGPGRPRKDGGIRGTPRTRADAPGVKEAKRQPKNPKPPKAGKNPPPKITETYLKKLVLHHIPTYVRLEARVRQDIEQLREYEKEAKTEGGAFAVKMLRCACKLSDERRAPIVDRRQLEATTASWMGIDIEGVPEDADPDSTPGLEEAIDPIGESSAGNGGNSYGDAEQPDERPGFYDRETGSSREEAEMGGDDGEGGTEDSRFSRGSALIRD